MGELVRPPGAAAVSELTDAQSAFADALGELLRFVAARPDLRVTLGCAHCERDHHVPGSFHAKRLAVDLNLFRWDPDAAGDGPPGAAGGAWRYCGLTADHLELGERWEELGGTWGGRFASPDGNHYSWGEGARARRRAP